MTGTIPFQYAIIQYTGDVETNEFLNIGLAFYCSSEGFLRIHLLNRYERVTDVFPETDGELYRSRILRLQSRFDALAADFLADRSRLPAFANAPLDFIALLRQVLPSPDAAIRVGELHYGVTENPDEMFEYLYDRLVLRHLKKHDLPSRTDDEIWGIFKRPLVERKLITRLAQTVIETKHEKQTFAHTWENGKLNVLLPQSFDLVKPISLIDKAHRILGRAMVLQDSKEKPHLVLLVGTPRSEEQSVQTAYENAKGMIHDKMDALSVEIVEETDADRLAQRVEADTAAHM